MTNELTIERELLYGGPLHRGRRYQYFARLGSERIANTDEREECRQRALQALLDAYRYVGSLTQARVAADGTVICVREIGPDCAQVEYHRDGRSSGITMGRMTSGLETFRTVREYADYLLAQYQGAPDRTNDQTND
jgi:hypothetical protein